MPRPRFSIVVPTRERHQTLAYAIQSVLSQDYPEFELIVQDNASSDDTWKVVRQHRSPKIKYQRSPYTLPMNENWEAALALCEGEYVYFMGDDDALMPDGLRLASDILTRMPLEILTWQKYTYWWDSTLEPTYRGRLFLHLGCDFRKIDTRAALEAFYDWRVGFGVLPSVYTSLVRHDVIDRAKSLTGGVYFPVGAPDVWTGILNCLAATDVGMFERGISLSGNSGASTGCAYFFRSKGEDRRKAYLAEEGKTLEELTHPSLIPSVNLEINHADHQLRARDMLFPNDPRLQVRMPLVLAAMAANINRDPDSYEVTLSEINALAQKHGVDIAILNIPQRASSHRTAVQGPVLGPDHKIQTLAINCIEAGVHDCNQAARLAAAVLPTITIQ
jgi:hypothetical protein